MTNTRCSYFHCASYLHNMKHCHSQNSLQKLHNLILSFCLHCIVHFDTLNLFLDSILTFNKKKKFPLWKESLQYTNVQCSKRYIQFLYFVFQYYIFLLNRIPEINIRLEYIYSVDRDSVDKYLSEMN